LELSLELSKDNHKTRIVFEIVQEGPYDIFQKNHPYTNSSKTFITGINFKGKNTAWWNKVYVSRKSSNYCNHVNNTSIYTC
jgi:hypothetical protein